MSLTTSWTEGDAVREWRQSVRKLLLLLYTASLLTSLGCFLWNASAPVRVHSAPKCYPSKGDEFSLAPVPTLPADSILNTGDAAALDALPGIGTVLSERIITYREEHGAFVYPEDLRNVQGIGAELQTKITDSLDDESTNPLIAPAAETTTVPRATLPPDSILNTGDAAALDALPGIGPVLSERIITYREECGTFVYPEDLRNIDGIGAALQTKIIDSLDDELTNPPIAPAAETATVPRATLPPDSILNTGDAAALDALPGIGTVLSERIVAYREEHGAFVYPEELRNVKGIGEKRLQAILDALAGESAEESD